MASAFKVGSAVVVQFVDDDGKRWTIRPGHGDVKKGAEFARRVERLQALRAVGEEPDKLVALWLDRLPAKTRKKLADAGLLDPRSAVPTLGEYLDGYLQRRTDVKATTLAKMRQTAESLRQHLGADRRLNRVSPTDAAAWRAWFGRRVGAHGNRISESTVRIHTRNAKTIFRQAVQEKLISASPFDHLKGATLKADKTWRYVDRQELRGLLAACDPPWRTLFALCRLAGLRRGEALRLTWADVDWGNRRLTVLPEEGKRTTKQRRRVVPIEPELYEVLTEAYDVAAEGQALVVGINAANIDIMARRRIRWAGFEVWAKPFHTLRKNRETDWAQRYPQYVVAEWMGHSIQVSADHYLRVPDELFAKASGAAESAAAMRRDALKSDDGGLKPHPTGPNQAQFDAISLNLLQEYPRQGSNLQPSAPEADALSN